MKVHSFGPTVISVSEPVLMHVRGVHFTVCEGKVRASIDIVEVDDYGGTSKPALVYRNVFVDVSAQEFRPVRDFILRTLGEEPPTP